MRKSLLSARSLTIVATLSFLLWIAGGGVARANGQTQVVALVLDDGSKPLLPRLMAELNLLDLQPMLVERNLQPDIRAELSLVADELPNAAAVMALIRMADAVDVWVIERSTQTTTVRRVPLDSGDDGQAVVTWRVIDFLRGLLMHLPKQPEDRVVALPTSTPVAEPPTTEGSAMKRTSAIGMRLAPALIGSPGPVGMALDGDVRITWQGPSRVGAGVVALFPVRSAQLQSGAQSARIDVNALAAFVSVERGAARPRRFVAFGGLGLGVLWLRMQGITAGPGFEPREDSVLSALGLIQGGIAWCATSNFRITVDGTVGAALPWPGVKIGTERVANWGLPLAMGSLGLEMRLP